MREGSLEAPIRRPIDWRNSDYFDETLLEKEMERVFDVCHTCRRCVSLCKAFPTLFDLIDEAETGELDSVDKADFSKVVDKCYLCDMCYMSKCPYVPPHEWNIDFPHLMLRAKAVSFKKGKIGFRDRLISGTDRLGKFATIPIVRQTVNATNDNRITRKLMHSTLGIHRDRKLPSYASKTFRKSAQVVDSFEEKRGNRVSGKVVIFSTCYVNYNEPNIGEALKKVLNHNEIPSQVLKEENCCGMPKLELGDLEAVRRLKEKNIPTLANFVQQGYAIISAVPSCTLMFKQELPLLFPEEDEVVEVAKAIYDPFEYFMLRLKDGLLKKSFKNSLGNVAYHIPCHLRVQNMGQKTKEFFDLIPETKVTVIERCAGHDGTWGVKTEHFEDSMKIGRPVFRKALDSKPRYVSSDCAIAGRHIAQGMAKINSNSDIEVKHPLELVKLAYGI